MDGGTNALWRRRLKRIGLGGRIAVVGNAGNELDKEKGREIDEHDCVLRFNNYVLEGYEKDYGKKTTHWVTSFWFDIVHRDLSSFRKTLCPFPLNDPVWVGKYFASKYHAAHDIFYVTQNKAQIECIPLPLFESLREINSSPSSGLLLLYWLRECWDLADVDLYGFDFFDAQKGLHYFDLSSRSSHKGDSEKETIQSWIREAKWRM